MADVAFVFHWGLAELEALPVLELMAWQRQAARVWNRAHKGAEDEE
ncbi:MAG: GpE family phage tail protein [Shimia sp.]